MSIVDGQTLSIRCDEPVTCADCDRILLGGESYVDFEVSARPADDASSSELRISYAPRLVCEDCSVQHAFHPLSVKHIPKVW